MNGTPRLRSAFPDTPKTEPGSFRSSPVYGSTPLRSRSKRESVIRPTSNIKPATPTLPSGASSPSPVSLDFLDGPTQRKYATAFWVALLGWRILNYSALDGSDAESLWQFMKWCSIDFIFLSALSSIRIPWIEWSFPTVLLVFLGHAVLNAFLFLGVSLPITAWLSALVRVAYDRELSLTDVHVKPADILHNSSIILGKQIINLLPEGSAVFNPDGQHFCVDALTTSVELPIVVNQTTPEVIELQRFDPDTEEVEIIVIGAKQARKLKAAADKGHDKHDLNSPRTLLYPAHKKGLYRLSKVIDKSKLEVRRKNKDLAIVACPRASISASQVDKCTGDLSSIALHVSGVPPFNVKYSKRVNNHRSSSISQTIQPADDDATTMGQSENSNVVVDPRRPQMDWMHPTSTSVEINESLNQNGTWMYTIEEVEDGLRNKVTFETESTKKLETAHHAQAVTVHRRPLISFKGCDGEHFLKVPQDQSLLMPLQIKHPEQIPAGDWPFKMQWTFTPDNDETVPAVESYEHDIDDASKLPVIGRAGRYDLTNVQSKFCQGEVSEPSSCLISNPPRPALTYQTEEIFDKCAGRPIGMLVNFDFTGSPPFKVQWDVTRKGHRPETKTKIFNSMRGQMELRERDAGSYKYDISEISDDVYKAISIRRSENTFQQDIRPPAGAAFMDRGGTVKACLGQPVPATVRLSGEAPWDLEYELVHAGKRKKFSIQSEQDMVSVEVPPQSEGGSYSLVLTGVQDASRCKTALRDERQIEVRPEQPRAGFGDIDGRRHVEALEGKKVRIPLKLRGIPPWTVDINNEEKGPFSKSFTDANAFFDADHAGTYQLLSVRDSCPGTIDPKADTFDVSWIRRPELSVNDATAQLQGNLYHKEPVCQGDADSLKLGLVGHAPWHIKYQVKAEPAKGQVAVSNKPLSAATKDVLIDMDTSKAGHYTYTFNELSDDRYAHDRKHFHPLIIRQEVFAPPTAQFASPGKTYGYCHDDSSNSPADAEIEQIPIALTGSPPFAVDIAISHRGASSRPEIIRIRDIFSTSYSWSLPRSTLPLGHHTVSIRAVRDSRGCESAFDATTASKSSQVNIHVSSPPSISPLTDQTDYCVGDHIAFALSGTGPFTIFYSFAGRNRKATANTHEFRRITDTAGEMIVTGVSDSATSKCRASKEIHKFIHPYPTVRLARGKTMTSDIHEGGEVDLHFEFTGTPPFEFVYTRSENVGKGKGKKAGKVLERRTGRSDGFAYTDRVSEEGTYEVVSIRDAFCSYSAEGGYAGGGGQKLLQN